MRTAPHISSARARPSSRRAFTLIELLIVVTILSLLVAILLPSLASAKAMAKAIVCTTNLRSIATAWHVYLTDSDESFPKMYRETSPGTFRAQNVQWFYGGKQPCVYDTLYGTTLPFRPLNPYLDQSLTNEQGTGIFQCAADGEIRHATTGVSNTEGYKTYEYYGNSYMMNHLLLVPLDSDGAEVRDQPFRLTSVEIPLSVLAVAGDCQWYYTVNNLPWNAQFHNKEDKMGVGFLDGHAEFLRLVRGEPVTAAYSFSPYREE